MAFKIDSKEDAWEEPTEANDMPSRPETYSLAQDTNYDPNAQPSAGAGHIAEIEKRVLSLIEVDLLVVRKGRTKKEMEVLVKGSVPE